MDRYVVGSGEGPKKWGGRYFIRPNGDQGEGSGPIRWGTTTPDGQGGKVDTLVPHLVVLMSDGGVWR